MYTSGFWTSLNTTLNAISDVLLTIVIVLLLILFKKLGFFRKPVHTVPSSGEAEIVKWSPIDNYACRLSSVTVQDGEGNVAHARFSMEHRGWRFACNNEPLNFKPTEYRSSAAR